jgi:hypothetical protein
MYSSSFVTFIKQKRELEFPILNNIGAKIIRNNRFVNGCAFINDRKDCSSKKMEAGQLLYLEYGRERIGRTFI